jgi:protein-disulfide isomerase
MVRELAWRFLPFVAAAILGAAGWFVYLQLFELGEICGYCMADHALGVAAAVLILFSAVRLQVTSLALPAVAGLFVAAVLVVLQVVQPATVHQLDTQTAGDFERANGHARQVGVLDGKLEVAVADEPHMGDADAEHALVMLFDYCCPHCRGAHRAIEAIQRQADVVVVTLPAPIGSPCNPHFGELNERFDDSCALGELALAVFAVDSAKWRAFDRWLFEPQMPRTAEAARAEAARLVGREALEAALASEQVKSMLKRNMDAYALLPEYARRTPVLMKPGAPPLYGRIESAAVIADYLRNQQGTNDE